MPDPIPSPTGVDPSPFASVVTSDEQTEVPVDAERWAALAADALRSERCTGELTLTFVDRDEMAALNSEYMNQDGPTDVLSFPLDAADSAVAAGPVLLGDVVICPAVARDAAPGHAGTLDDELALLTVHGVLHVLGHDHADPVERAEMQAREMELLVAHHFDGPPPPGFRHDHEPQEFA